MVIDVCSMPAFILAAAKAGEGTTVCTKEQAIAKKILKFKKFKKFKNFFIDYFLDLKSPLWLKNL